MSEPQDIAKKESANGREIVWERKKERKKEIKKERKKERKKKRKRSIRKDDMVNLLLLERLYSKDERPTGY